ncbi:MAG: hypothetical protein CVU78_07500 [Elusimicrobia bacterium HGW-Elusimicrobia-2]|nr:MAG: hypothetical protein CVU78_07500 [Elusimicrobia bacterium HGW-Elusimicrobia-2]
MRKGKIKDVKRNYLSVYLPLIASDGKRHSKNVCIAFNDGEKPLFDELKKLTSQDIKKAISIFTYKKLIERAEKENRKPTELIKLLLAEKLINKSKKINRNIAVNPRKIKKWVGILKKNKIDGEIADFLEGMISDDRKSRGAGRNK